SIFGMGQVSFRDYLYLDFTARNDWASVLPINNNSFFYPSATLSAIASDIFGITSDAVSFIKLRAGWAKVSSAVSLESYNIESSYQFSAEPWGTTPVAFLPGTLWNPDIQNQESQEYEVGFDARFLRNRLRVDFTYYDKKTENVILPVQVSSTSGFTQAWDNAATITNKGIEIQLGADIFSSEDPNGFNLGVNVNFARNVNEVNDIDDDPTTNNGVIDLGDLWNVTNQAREGEPIGVLYGPAFARDEASGEIIYENGLPQIDETYQILGNITPDWTGGLSLNMSYKRFSLNTLFDVK